MPNPLTPSQEAYREVDGDILPPDPVRLPIDDPNAAIGLNFRKRDKLSPHDAPDVEVATIPALGEGTLDLAKAEIPADIRKIIDEGRAQRQAELDADPQERFLRLQRERYSGTEGQ